MRKTINRPMLPFYKYGTPTGSLRGFIGQAPTQRLQDEFQMLTPRLRWRPGLSKGPNLSQFGFHFDQPEMPLGRECLGGVRILVDDALENRLRRARVMAMLQLPGRHEAQPFRGLPGRLPRYS